MVFVTAIRDYIDWINASFDALGQEMSAVQFLQQTFFYLASSLKVGLIYIATFQWLRDLAYLPILIPQYTEAIVKEQLYFGETQYLTFLALLKRQHYYKINF